LYGHIEKLALAELKGIEKAGGTATIYRHVLASLVLSCSNKLNRIAETLPEEVLVKMYAPPKPDYPVITNEEMLKYDAFLFGKSSPHQHQDLPNYSSN
jgi:NAD(P)H dehydrogenase (quinone)